MSKQVSKKKRLLTYEKYGGHCSYCGIGIEYDNMQIDHIVPVQRGFTKEEAAHYGIKKGNNELENLNPSCGSCNSSKSSFELEVWRTELEKKTFRLTRDSSSFRILERFGLVKLTGDKITFYFERYGTR